MPLLVLKPGNVDFISLNQMDYGNVVRMYVFLDGRKKEVAKGIMMALVGTKHVKKVIPKGWRYVKITSYTSNAATEACSIPASWANQVKYKTMKEVIGQSILWLLYSILHI